MAKVNSVKAIPMASFDTADLTTAYQVIDAAGLDAACFLLRINNASGSPILVSYDGTTDHDYVKNGEKLQVPFQINSNTASSVANMANRTKVYVKGAGAGQGLIYLSGYYQ